METEKNPEAEGWLLPSWKQLAYSTVSFGVFGFKKPWGPTWHCPGWLGSGSHLLVAAARPL